MSRYEVDALIEAVEHADDLFDEAPFLRMTKEEVNRRYAEWITEYLNDHGWRLTRLEVD